MKTGNVIFIALTQSVLMAPFLFLACSTKEKENIDARSKTHDARTIIVTTDSLKKICAEKMSDLVESYRLIKLETKDASIIGKIKQIQNYQNKFYILEEGSKTGILVFGDSGKYLHRIGRPGHGPREFIQLKSFALQNDEIALLDSEGRKVQLFSLDGDFLQEFPTKYAYSNIETLDSTHLALICIGTQSGFDLHLYTKEGSLIDSLFTKNDKTQTEIGKPLIRYADSLLYMQNYNDTVYAVNTYGKSDIHTIVDYGEHKITDKKLKRAMGGVMIPTVDFMGNTRNYTETDQFVYFSFDYDKFQPDSPYYLIWNKKLKRQCIYTNSIIDDLSFYPYAPQIETVNSANEFIAIMQPYALLDEMRKQKLKQGDNTRYKQMQLFLEDITELSNPILIMLKFKNLDLE